jgi:hypothetical protein
MIIRNGHSGKYDRADRARQYAQKAMPTAKTRRELVELEDAPGSICLSIGPLPLMIEL